ncbi:DUF11 domain-containing protein [Nocardioides pacificus]
MTPTLFGARQRSLPGTRISVSRWCVLLLLLPLLGPGLTAALLPTSARGATVAAVSHCPAGHDGYTGVVVEGNPVARTVPVRDTLTGTDLPVRVVVRDIDVTFTDAATGLPLAVTFCIKASNINTGPLGPSSWGSTDGLIENKQGVPQDISHLVLYSATSTTPPSDDVAVSVDKSVDKTTAAPGDVVTFTLTVRNAGPGRARDVVATDTLPPGTTYRSAVSAAGPCESSGQSITCRLGDLAAGAAATVTIKVTVDPVAADVDPAAGHQLSVTKIESHLAVAAGTTGSSSVTCPAGYLASDGSVRLDAVDQGSGTFADAVVLRSAPTADGDGWAGTLRNDATGQVQAKVNAVCVSRRTTSGDGHSHALVVSPPETSTRTFPPGTTDIAIGCGTGRVAVAPGFTLSGEATVGTRRDATGWRFIVTTPAGTSSSGVTGTISVRCLSTALDVTRGHSHELALGASSGTVSVPAGQVAETSLTCADGSKGILAWADFRGTGLGTDPRPVTRVYRFYNSTDTTLSGDYGLLCLAVRTSGERTRERDLTNVASVSTTSHDTTTSDDSDSATVRVAAPPGAAGITVARQAGVVTVAGRTSVALRVAVRRGGPARLELVSTKPVAGTRLDRGDRLAVGVLTLRAGHHTLRLRPVRAATRALRTGEVGRARLVIVAGAERRVQPVRLVR